LSDVAIEFTNLVRSGGAAAVSDGQDDHRQARAHVRGVVQRKRGGVPLKPVVVHA
jgi:hypothetical protein